MAKTKRTVSQTGAEFRKVPADDIRFDPTNPRLGGDSSTSQPKLQALLMGEPHFANLLVDSFVENGFIEYEPLVVRQSGNHYVVIEGNRRLAAVKHILANSDQYPPSVLKGLREIPVLVFHQRADSSHVKDIRTYLGVRHLQGYREWPAESKAMFLDQNIRSKSDLTRIKREFAIQRGDIARYLIPYRVKKAASALLDEFESPDDQQFWILGEALTRVGIREYVQLEVDRESMRVKSFDKTKLQYLLEFLYGSTKTAGRGSTRAAGMRRITDTRQLSRLAKVLANTRAAEKLENGSTLEEAELYLTTPEEAIDGLIKDLSVLLQKVIALEPNAAQVKKIESSFRSFERAMKSVE
jgi:hypothetical protein